MAQRVVLSVGLGAALLVAAAWWIVGDLLQPSGWFAYAPGSSTDTYMVVRRRDPTHLAIALGVVAAWTAASVVLFRPQANGSEKVEPAIRDADPPRQ